MGEKIDLSFPAGFHTLMLGNMRCRVSVSHIYMVTKKVKSDRFVDGYSIQSIDHAMFLLLFLLHADAFHISIHYKLPWVQWHPCQRKKTKTPAHLHLHLPTLTCDWLVSVTYPIVYQSNLHTCSA